MRSMRGARIGRSAEEASFCHQLATLFYGAGTLMITVHLMILLRPVLEPFLWAMFIVMALHPLTQMFQRLLHNVCQVCCSAWAVCARRVRRRFGDTTLARVVMRFRWRARFLVSRSRQATTLEPAHERPTEAVLEAGGLRVDGEQDGIAVAEEACSEASSCLSRPVAVCCALIVVMAMIGTMFTIVFDACVVLKGDFHIYEKGLWNVVDVMQAFSERIGPPEMLNSLLHHLLEEVKNNLSSFITVVLSHAGNIIGELAMLCLYVMFWLFSPMPYRNTAAGRIFRRYLLFKGGVCLAYGVCVYTMLHNLQVSIPQFFGLLSCLFSFVPEVGALVAMVLPLPVILFDSRLEAPWATMGAALLGQLAMKFIFANVVEVVLVENDPAMKMHPVVTLLAFCFFGFTWGPTGMLLSVPLVALAKAVLHTDIIPGTYRDPILVFIEGDENAPLASRRPTLDAENPWP